MNRKQFLSSIAGVGLTGAVTSSTTAAPRPKSPLALTILPSAIGDGYPIVRKLSLSPTAPRIRVAIQNISKEPLRLWNENSQWGSGNLSLEITAIGGSYVLEPIKVVREVTSWYSNTATFTHLPPGEMIVREIALEFPKEMAGGHVWKTWPYKGFPFEAISERRRFTGEYKSVEMHAIFEIRPEYWSEQEQVWTGRVKSPESTYVLNMNERD